MVKRICVIGAGPAGLTAVKSCLEQGLDVVCYEKTDALGGSWVYREEVIDGVGTVTKSTYLNTSKELSAFSDFPPNQDSANYMHNTAWLEYLQAYAAHFNLDESVKLNHEVVSVQKSPEHQTHGGWQVLVRSKNQVRQETFDGVMLCNGHFHKPFTPNFKGMKSFKGDLSHTHTFRTPNSYEDKVVVVVGVGPSGLDAACDVAPLAKQVYLCTRRGTWITPRIRPRGKPNDLSFISRFVKLLISWLPFQVSCYLIEKYLNSKFDHELYGLKPNHRALSQHPAICDTLPNYVLNGRLKIKCNIKSFTETGVIFDNEEVETKCDSVIFGTGFELYFPFLDPSLISVESNTINLYKHVFQPGADHPETFAFIGLVQPSGPIFPVAEMQCRWFVQLIQGKCKLPPRKDIETDIDTHIKNIRQAFYHSARHTLELDFMSY